MKTISTLVALLCVVVASVLIGYSPSPLAAQGSSSPRDKTAEEYAASLPKDIYPDSRSRIPLIKREDLDEEGKKSLRRSRVAEHYLARRAPGPGGVTAPRESRYPANRRGPSAAGTSQAGGVSRNGSGV